MKHNTKGTRNPYTFKNDYLRLITIGLDNESILVQYKVSRSLQNKLFTQTEFSLMLDLSSLTAVRINECLVLLKLTPSTLVPRGHAENSADRDNR